MDKKLKYIIIIAVALVAVAITLKSTGVIESGTKGIEVQTEQVMYADIVETVTASGKIQPEREIKIAPEVSGEIIALPIQEGEKVKKGDLLVKINPDVYESSERRAVAAVRSARASLNQSEAQFVEAEKNYNRNKKLYDKGVISDAEFESFERAYTVADLARESAKSNLESAEASLKEARDNLKRTTIIAPQDGSISKLNVELSERVVGTAQMAGTELLRVANLEAMEVLVEVNENDIVKVAIGDTSEIEVDAYLDETFLGVVTEIANSANTAGVSADQVTNFEVKVKILSSSYAHLSHEGMESPFRPGMTASVDIRTEVVKNVMVVPIQSVTIRSDTTQSRRKYGKKSDENTDDKKDESFEVVFEANGSKATIHVVKTGVQDDQNIQIIEGLDDDLKIIKGPYTAVSKLLKNGSEIQVESASDE